MTKHLTKYLDETSRQAAPEPQSEDPPASSVTIPVEKLQAIEERVNRLAHFVQNLRKSPIRIALFLQLTSR